MRKGLIFAILIMVGQSYDVHSGCSNPPAPSGCTVVAILMSSTEVSRTRTGTILPSPPVTLEGCLSDYGTPGYELYWLDYEVINVGYLDTYLNAWLSGVDSTGCPCPTSPLQCTETTYKKEQEFVREHLTGCFPYVA